MVQVPPSSDDNAVRRKPGRPPAKRVAETGEKRKAGRPRKKPLPNPPKEPVYPEYTEEKQARAMKRIAKKLATEDTEQVHKNYMEVMFRSFLRRIDKARASGELDELKSIPKVSDLPPLPKFKSGPRRPPRSS
jgi:hypothetical protein